MIVGDGEERAAWRGKWQRAGWRGSGFAGSGTNRSCRRFFDLATVFVLPSRHEPWGLIVNEVMNAGRAVIVSDEVGCQPDWLRTGWKAVSSLRGMWSALTDALRQGTGDAGDGGCNGAAGTWQDSDVGL